ncbi:MAG TPA: glycogen synthase GlgA [Clostridiales bacterium]|nr:glycogen synthase GlgA [Clostridiales bacterium]
MSIKKAGKTEKQTEKTVKAAQEVKKEVEKEIKAAVEETVKAAQEVKEEAEKQAKAESVAAKKEEKKEAKAAKKAVKEEVKTEEKSKVKATEKPAEKKEKEAAKEEVKAEKEAVKKAEAKAKTAKKVAKKVEKTDKEAAKLEEKADEEAQKEDEKLEEKLVEKEVEEEKSENIIPEENKEQTESQQKDIEVEVTRKRSLLFVASECNPFVGTGGLADVIGSLPIAISDLGEYDVRVILPLYGTMEEGYRNHLTYIGNFNVPVGWRNQYCGLFSYKRKGVTYLFIDNEYYFRRSTLYGHYDDGERFAFFSRAVLEAMLYMNWYPDVMHCHDWQTALAVIYLKTIYANRWGFDHIRAIFTIHNIEYQGKYGKEILEDLFGLPWEVEPALDYDGCLNLMKGAIQLSDYVTTVSKTYAEEIKNEYFAHGLQYAINDNAGKLIGILNGISEEVYNPETDKALFKNYSVDDMSGKAVCKAELQKMLGLQERTDAPIIAIISRLVAHKGLDLVKCVLEELLAENVQVVILGKGEPYYEGYFSYIADNYKGKCKTIIAYNKDLSSKIYSGADIFLMPSKQEPCGLSQMIACRYGTIPVVRRTGGLNDSITAYNTDRTTGNGFAFTNYNAHEMLYVLKDAIYTFGNKPEWAKIVKCAMTTDFSWKKSAEEYEKLYDLFK